jgi:two-component system, LytTR family, sensor histidine kinase AlgZ
MHPLLSRRSYLAAYLAVWLPLACLLVFLVKVSGGIGTLEATVLLVPMALLYAAACLATWYTCRATPLWSSGISRVAGTHLIAALLLSYLWAQIGRLYARGLSVSPSFAGLTQRYDAHFATLLVSGVLLYVVIVGFFYVLIALEASRAAEARVLETSVLARDAELKALKAQVNPHFLFNSLNSISALTSIDAERAQEMCILLAEFLRMTLGLGEKTAVPLREELELLKRFLAIEKVRFGTRLLVDQQVSAQAEGCLVPPLILQPLVENAILHGIANLPEGGTVRLHAQCDGGRLQISIENSVDPEAPPRRKGGLGLTNVRQRIEARYPREGSVRAIAEEDSFRVDLSIPAEFAAPGIEAAADGPPAQGVGDVKSLKDVKAVRT